MKIEEEDRHTLKFYYKMLLKTLLTQYQYVWHKASSSVFSLEILMSKMHLALVDEIMEKIEQDWRISSHDINKEPNIEHKTIFKSFGKGWIQKARRTT